MHQASQHSVWSPQEATDGSPPGSPQAVICGSARATYCAVDAARLQPLHSWRSRSPTRELVELHWSPLTSEVWTLEREIGGEVERKGRLTTFVSLLLQEEGVRTSLTLHGVVVERGGVPRRWHSLRHLLWRALAVAAERGGLLSAAGLTGRRELHCPGAQAGDDAVRDQAEEVLHLTQPLLALTG